jgi:hypothetical protein
MTGAYLTINIIEKDVWKKNLFQFNFYLLLFLWITEILVFLAQYFVLRAINNEMQSLATGVNESANTFPTPGSSTPTRPG